MDMDEELNPQFNLTIHPAYGEVIVIPTAVLQYHTLGIKPAEAMFLVHLMAAAAKGTVNLTAIAKQMGVARRTINIWLSGLTRAGLRSVPVYKNNRQQPNAYDLDELLTSLQHQRLEPDFDRLLERFQNDPVALDLIDTLARRLLDHSIPGSLDHRSLDHSVPGSLDHRSLDHRSLDHKRNGQATSGHYDPQFKGINDDDDDHHRSSLNGDSSSSLTSVTQQSLVVQMMQLGFSETDAKWQIAQAAKKQIELPAWFEFISNRGSAIRNPAGFLRAKITAGEKPPVVAKPTTSCGHARSYMSGGRCLVCAGVVRV